MSDRQTDRPGRLSDEPGASHQVVLGGRELAEVEQLLRHALVVIGRGREGDPVEAATAVDAALESLRAARLRAVLRESPAGTGTRIEAWPAAGRKRPA